MSYDVEFAKEFKNRNNKDIDEAVIGTIIAINPITVSLFNGKSIFTEGNNCYVSESLKEIKGTITLDNVSDHGTVTTNFTLKRDLKEKDEVICIPTAGGQKYIVTEKVGE